MKKVTMADVAKLADVSKSTVSQYLNKRYEYMSEETRKRIAMAIKELGYQPNFIARSLKQKTTMTIGVIVFNIMHMLTTQVLHAIEEECQERGFHVIVSNSDDDPEKEKKYIEMLRAKQVDGLIIFPTGKNADIYQKLIEERFPLVFVDRMVPEVKADAVLLDNQKAAELAVEYFAERGYEHIGIVTPPLVSHIVPRMERIEGFRQALVKKGLPVVDDYFITTEIPRIQKELTRLYESGRLPEALFAINDLTLMEVLYFIKGNHINTPDELAIISIDDVPFAHVYTPTLTTISQPTFAMGKKAAERLFLQIEKKSEHQPQVFRFSPTFIERGSVKEKTS
ncbi:LacI family DNA-binding transcriptional regulator [Aeribacillus composti]|uniref:LacI family DNA-binding transcriptional regulator n=1 Tax=Aeribacillus composti TaxID=1868734 RepID=A0ABY9W666_9BACI|nr:LacI family DNA-binding transcriptional regulator [Aeribacillus composti]WNF31654.1 LacI family DNA-binding transcriptional regulator [Aeribacillus composti]BBU39680.1 KDG operon repressor [Aeribacillus pallidus]